MNEQAFQWPEEMNAVSDVFYVSPEDRLVIQIIGKLTKFRCFCCFPFPVYRL